VCVCVCVLLYKFLYIPLKISKNTNPVPYIITLNGHAMNFKTKYLKDGLVGKANVTYIPGAGERNRNSDSSRTERSGVLSPVRVKILVSSKPVHTGPWTQPAPSTLGSGSPFLGGKATGARPSAGVKERVELCLYF
jgi:hypothetical protein